MFQILDVERMLAKSATPVEVLALETHQQQMENHPVIRTLYDHAEVCSFCMLFFFFVFAWWW
jgi:cleavage stimulation factor subunit 1